MHGAEPFELISLSSLGQLKSGTNLSGTFIHKTTIVDEGAIIGPGVHIWHFCHLMPGCRVGEGCNIGQNVFVDTNVVLGKRVKVQNNVSIYKGVLIEDDVFLGPSMVFTNISNPRSFISRKDKFIKTIVRTGATIGANATIVCGIEIGEYALIGAGAVVTKNILPYALVMGNPAKQAGWISRAGEPLDFGEGKTTAICPAAGDKYSLIGDKVVKLT